MERSGWELSDAIPTHLQAAARALRLEVGATEIISKLRSAGVEPILLKGPAITKWLYEGRVALRPPGDVDLLVDISRIDTTEAVLSSAGFQHDPFDDIPGDKPWHAHAWRHPGTGIEIDLHRTLIGADAEPSFVWTALLQHSEPFQLRGLEVRVLNEPARALHVALHAAQGGPRDTKALEDLRRAVALEEAVWAKARDVADVLDAREAMSAGLRLLPEGARIADALGLPIQVPVHVALRSSSSPAEAIGFAWLMTTPGLRAKLALIARKTFPPRVFMDVWYPADRRGSWGIVGAYAYRVRWLARNLPPAAKAWLTARRHRSSV